MFLYNLSYKYFNNNKKKYSQISYKNIFKNKRVVNMEEEMIWRVWDIF